VFIENVLDGMVPFWQHFLAPHLELEPHDDDYPPELDETTELALDSVLSMQLSRWSASTKVR